MYQITKPIWDITGAKWVDHAPNPRFAVWSAATSSQTDDVILDKETGLVWERSPSTNRMALSTAVVYSTTRVLGRRKGSRIPAIEELLSLVDPANTNPTLPTGPSGVTSKPAIQGHFKSGQRKVPGTWMLYSAVRFSGKSNL